MELVNDSQLLQLTNEYYILHLLYHRSRNQHRNQVWFKYLNILHRRTRIILKLAMDWQAPQIRNKSDIEQKVLANIKYLVKRVMAKAYYEFNGIIALGQFINLGLTMLGNLSKLHGILTGFGGLTNSIRIPELVSINQDDDIGEAIPFENTRANTNTTTKIIPTKTVTDKAKFSINDPPKVLPTKKKKDKDPSPAPHSVDIFAGNMDDIFGTTKNKKAKSGDSLGRSKKSKGKAIDDIFGPSKKKKKIKKDAIDDIFG